jgi:hypothetical protein
MPSWIAAASSAVSAGVTVWTAYAASKKIPTAMVNPEHRGHP